MHVKVHRHKLEDVPVLLDAALEGCVALVSRERDRRDRTAWIVHRHGEPAANAEVRRLVEESALRFRQTRRGEFLSPFEGLRRCQDLDDNRVYLLIAFPQIMICPLDRIARDERWRVALSRRQGKIGEAVQVECRTGLGKDSSETFSIDARSESVDKRLEDAMHASAPHLLGLWFTFVRVPSDSKLLLTIQLRS
jgi:hypothetical protein